MKYKIIKTDEIEKSLNKMASQGWEFVGFVPLKSGLCVELKQGVIFKK